MIVTVDPVAAATYFVRELGCTCFAVWGSKAGRCLCGDPHDGTGKHGPDNIGKHPATVRGFKDATADVTAIATFLHNPGTPNFGINAPPGVLVLDVDGEAGQRTWDGLQAVHGPLPVTLTTTTAHGRHYFFRWPAAVGPMPRGKLFGFVVRRHDDGYVIGPGSVHPTGTVYDTLRQESGMPYPIAELPVRWAEAALKPPLTVIVGGALPDVGGRHDWLRDRARHYAGVIRDPAALRAALMAENAKLSVPKTDAEVDRAIGAVLERFGPDPTDETTGEVLHGDELGLLPSVTVGNFPTAPAPVAFEGLLGECTAALAGGTDASLVGLLGSLLAFAGALIPGSAYFHRLQTSSPFIALVGESSIGRKGTAMMRANDAMADAVGIENVNRAILDGLNSGEGLISSLHWKATTFPYEPTVYLVFEEEYASLLASRGREGSTLDPKMRAGFDGGPLSNRRSSETKVVAPPYWLPALIGITPTELRSRLEPGALQSGSANRWLYLPVVRREMIPTNDLPVLPDRLKAALREAWRVMKDKRPPLAVDRAVTTTLSEYADFLPTSGSGLVRDLTRRFAVIAFRLALVHALTERSASVTIPFLDRALALTEYARRGLPWVFGDLAGNRDAALLLRALQAHGSLRKNTITRQLIRDPLRQQDAIDELVRLGVAKVVTVHPERGGPIRTELHASVGGGSFVPFVHGFGVFSNDAADSIGRMDERSSIEHETGMNGLDERLDERRTNVDERGRTVLPSETVLDTATGEVQTVAGAVWVEPCRDYPAHRNDHRNSAVGWYCSICRPDLVP